MSVKINSLEFENVKRVKAVRIEPTANGLTVIGGRNGQGKTSVLDSIAWALGGEKYRPSQAQREGSALPPALHIELSNGLIVERKGKNSALKVTDPKGQKGGQQLLNEFVEQFALDLPRFMSANNADKAKILLRIIGIEAKLAELDSEEQKLYNERHSIGVIGDRKRKYADEMISYEGVPDEPVSASELIAQQQEILARNGENQRKRQRLNEITYEKQRIFDEIQRLEAQAQELAKRIEERKAAYEQVAHDEEIARTDTLALQDQSTAELEENIRSIDEINRKIRANLDKEKAEEEAAQYADQYGVLTDKIEAIRRDRKKLLDSADLPLEGLSVADGELLYNGHKWDCMSGSDQLRVSTAIIRRLNPECGFVLLDKLEQMDTETLREFGEWLESEGLQAIATRVSTGDECSVIIEDGYSNNLDTPAITSQPQRKTWKAGQF